MGEKFPLLKQQVCWKFGEKNMSPCIDICWKGFFPFKKYYHPIVGFQPKHEVLNRNSIFLYAPTHILYILKLVPCSILKHLAIALPARQQKVWNFPCGKNIKQHGESMKNRSMQMPLLAVLGYWLKKTEQNTSRNYREFHANPVGSMARLYICLRWCLWQIRR